MPLEQRISATNIDIMQHVEFSQLAGVVCTGSIVVSDTIPTAATNGSTVWYGREFCEPLNQKQLRYVNLHENFHKGLFHCLPMYAEISKLYPKAANAAKDYVINLIIEDTDASFVQRPCKILINKKYGGWGWIEVLQDLLKNPPKNPPKKPPPSR